jgi:hypothetical protein
MLWGLSAVSPSDELLDPMKFQVFRGRLTPWVGNSGIHSMERMAAKGARIQVVPSDEYFLDPRSAGRVGSRTNGTVMYQNPNDYDPGPDGFAYKTIEVWPLDRVAADEQNVVGLLPSPFTQNYIDTHFYDNGALLSKPEVLANLPDASAREFTEKYFIWEGGDLIIDMTFIWDDIIETAWEQLQEAGIEAEWDFWEEPNWRGWFGPYDDNHAQNMLRYFEVYKHTYDKLKALDPDVKIVGPSFNSFDESLLKLFLDYVKDNDCVPYSLSWHEIDEAHWANKPHGIPERVQTIRDYMAANDIQIDVIDINELVSEDRMENAAEYISYFAHLEEAKVTSACRAVWYEPDGTFNGWSSMLGGLLTKDRQPRSSWWAHKAYAEITGTLVEIYNYPNRMSAIAGINEEEGKLRMVVARLTTQGTPRIMIHEVNEYPWLAHNDKVRVLAHKIPHTGFAALGQMQSYMDTEMTVVANQLVIDLPDFGHDEVLVFELSPAIDATTDSDGDGLPNLAETETGTYVNPSNTGTKAFIADTDADGLPDGAEVLVAGTNPHKQDSNNDGMPDLLHYALGMDTEPLPFALVTGGSAAYEIAATTAANVQYAIDCSLDGITWYRVAVKAPAGSWTKDESNDTTPIFPGIASLTVVSTANGVQIKQAPGSGSFYYRTVCNYIL